MKSFGFTYRLVNCYDSRMGALVEYCVREDGIIEYVSIGDRVFEDPVAIQIFLLMLGPGGLEQEINATLAETNLKKEIAG